MTTGYMLNDIASANEMFAEHNKGFGYCVFLGRDVMDDFETFETMFAGVVGLRI